MPQRQRVSVVPGCWHADVPQLHVCVCVCVCVWLGVCVWGGEGSKASCGHCLAAIVSRMWCGAPPSSTCGGENQVWVPTPEGTIVSAIDGQCLSVYPRNGANPSLRGWDVVTLPCESGSTNQQWTMNTDGTVRAACYQPRFFLVFSFSLLHVSVAFAL